MSLKLTRREGESIILRLEPDATDAEIRQLITEGLRIEVLKIKQGSVRLAIDAPLSVSAVRDELLDAHEQPERVTHYTALK